MKIKIEYDTNTELYTILKSVENDTEFHTYCIDEYTPNEIFQYLECVNYNLTGIDF